MAACSGRFQVPLYWVTSHLPMFVPQVGGSPSKRGYSCALIVFFGGPTWKAFLGRPKYYENVSSSSWGF